MGKKVFKPVLSSIKGSVKDPFGQIGKDTNVLLGTGKGAEATAAASQQAANDAAAQRLQFEAQTKALADEQAKALARQQDAINAANAKANAQNQLNNISGTDNVVQVQQGAPDNLDLGTGTPYTKKKKGNSLSTSLGL